MEKFESIEIENSASLKRPTIYFFLKDNGFSEHYIKNLRNANCAILLNDHPATVREKIEDGDILKIAKNLTRKTDIFPCEGKLEILFEDDDYLIINKPHNLACTPSRSHFFDNLGGQICRYMQEKDENFVLRILNRLDRETAGIVVVAKNVIAYNRMQDLKKEYHAICHGKIDHPFTIDKPILTITHDGINEIKRVISPNGKRAITHVEPIKDLEELSPISKEDFLNNFSTNVENGKNQYFRLDTSPQDDKAFKEFTLVKLTLETGRTHQIRVHMADAGHPLVQDTLYGTEHSYTKTTYAYNSPHAMLLLKKISFTHFRTQEKIAIEIPYPYDWKNFETKG